MTPRTGTSPATPSPRVWLTAPGRWTCTSLPGGEATAHYWLAVGDEFFSVKDDNDMVVRRGPDTLIERTNHYWRHWVTREALDLTGLDPGICDLYRRSLLIVRTQTDDGGAIIAANDSDILQFGRDTYTYMWPRDGALVVEVLIQANHRELARRFFDFCLRAIQPGGFMLHKYNPDGTPGSSLAPMGRQGRQPHPADPGGRNRPRAVGPGRL